MKKKAFIYVIIAICVIVIGLFAFSTLSKKSATITITTDKVGRADISNTVTATGTLEASVTVEVGTQVSGKIDKIYADFNSKVEKGQLIALLDTETLESTLESSKATLDQAQAEFNYQEANYKRYKKLIEKKLIAQEDFDEAEYNYKSSIASLNSAKASYAKNKTNLEYAYIYSPINGIVLERNVEEGETVAASFETPTLFTIVNDLTQMEIEADVDEADIGHVKVGQRVEFTVDAFPDNIFSGVVTEIHLMPVEDSNVITYTVIIDSPNPDQILMPGMTANVTFFVTEKKNIVTLPNLALEFSPDAQLLHSYQELNPGIKIIIAENTTTGNSARKKTVWIKTSDKIYPQTVELGETDEINYEVLSGISEGTEVIISMDSQVQASMESREDEAAQSPFMPTPPGKNKKK